MPVAYYTDGRFLLYGDTEKDYLRAKDPVLGKLIDSIDYVYEYVDPDLFTSLMRIIIGQQITIAFYEKLWAAVQQRFGEIPKAEDVLAEGREFLTGIGVPSMRAGFIIGIAERFVDGSIDAGHLASLPDDELYKSLLAIRGVGPWTAEMVMLFYFERKDVFSFKDIALIRGLKRMYGLEEVPAPLFEEFRKRFSPYGTIASLYIWEVGEGRVEGFPDTR